MTPIGYMAKDVSSRPDWLDARNVQWVCSLSGCVSSDFMDYIDQWRHNGYWLFDSPAIIDELITCNGVDSKALIYFYYEAYEQQYDQEEGAWSDWQPEESFPTNVLIPDDRILLGYDVVSFFAGNAPECSYLSCNHMAEQCRTNALCLFGNFSDAKEAVDSGVFNDCEPGPCRIIAVYLSPAQQGARADALARATQL